MASIVDTATFTAVRLIEVGSVLTRVEFTVALATTLVVFTNICIMYYNATLGLAQLFRAKSMHWFMIPVGVIGVLLSRFTFGSSIEHIEFAMKYNIPLFSAFHFVFPLLPFSRQSCAG
jgi:spore germination protein KB